MHKLCQNYDMLDGLSPTQNYPKTEHYYAPISINRINTVQKNDTASRTEKSSAPPKDRYSESSERIHEKSQFIHSILEGNFNSFEEKVNTWDTLQNLDENQKALMLANSSAEIENLNPTAQKSYVELIVYQYPKADTFYKELLLETLEVNLKQFISMVDELSIDEFQKQLFIQTLAEDEHQSTPQLKFLTSRFISELMSDKKFSDNNKKLLQTIRETIYFKKNRTDGADAKMWYNLMPELEAEKEAIKKPFNLINDVDNLDSISEINEYRINKESKKIIHRSGIAIILHASASLSRFHASISSLDIFRMPYTITEIEAESFINKLLIHGFKNVIVLLPDSEIWTDYNFLKNLDNPNVHIVDTKTAGLGLGMILNELVKKISQDHHSVISNLQILDESIYSLKHWVILFNHQRIKYKDWLKHYAYITQSNEKNLCVIQNDPRPNLGIWTDTLPNGFEIIKNDISELITNLSRIVIVHESPYHDEVIEFAYDLRKLSATLPILVRHHAPRQKPIFGRHISIAAI